MIILVIILSLILLILAWIVLVPLILKIDTTKGQYEVGQLVTFRFSLHPYDDALFKLRLFGFRVDLKQKPAKKESQHKKRGKTKPEKSFHAWRSLIKEIPTGFRLRYLYGSIDFDDVVLNAKMVPVMIILNRGPVHVNTNFTGQSFLQLRLDIKIYMLLWILFKFLTKK